MSLQTREDQLLQERAMLQDMLGATQQEAEQERIRSVCRVRLGQVSVFIFNPKVAYFSLCQKIEILTFQHPDIRFFFNFFNY